LTPDEESAIRALARPKRLRPFAADFGGSPEIVRSICRRAEPLA
jgi:hypothetical protein